MIVLDASAGIAALLRAGKGIVAAGEGEPGFVVDTEQNTRRGRHEG